MSEIPPKTSKNSPLVIWAGPSDLVYKEGDTYHYRLKIGTTLPYYYRNCQIDLKKTYPYFQEGWPFLIKGSDEITFIEKPKELFYDIANAAETRKNESNAYFNIYFTLPFPIQDWMYIAPMNQYDCNFSNEEIVAELNSYWPYTFNSYENE